MNSKIKSKIIIILFSFIASVAIAQDLTISNASEFKTVEHKLYFVTTANTVTLGWRGTGGYYKIRGYHVESDKYYTIPELDGDISNEEAKIKIPRTGHWYISVRACATLNGNEQCSDWADSTKSKTEQDPIGWWVFARPAPVTGGGIDDE